MQSFPVSIDGERLAYDSILAAAPEPCTAVGAVLHPGGRHRRPVPGAPPWKDLVVRGHPGLFPSALDGGGARHAPWIFAVVGPRRLVGTAAHRRSADWHLLSAKLDLGVGASAQGLRLA